MHYTIWVTYACNLKCAYCYEEKEKKNNRMTIQTANNVLSYIKKRSEDLSDNEIGISLHGGEPLLNYDVLSYIVKKIRAWEKNVRIDMTTNATLLNESNISFIIENIDELSISIDGSQGVHDTNRIYKDGRGSFSDVVKSLEKLLEYKKGILARMTVTPETVVNLYNNVIFLHNLGFKMISPIIDQYDDSWNEKSMSILGQQLFLISDYCKTCQEDIQIGLLEETKYRKKSKCCPGEMTMHIDPNGDIYPCAYVVGNHSFEMGNIVTGINEEKLQDIKDINCKEIENCRLCSWKEYCYGYRCRLFNYAISENYEPGYTACKLERTLLQVHKYCTMWEKEKTFNI